MALLEAKGLGIRFGGLKAVDEFNFEIDENQLFGLIGPNGAGTLSPNSTQPVSTQLYLPDATAFTACSIAR